MHRFGGDQLELVRGLKPKMWLCVGSGFVREDIKSALFQNRSSFVSDAVTTPELLAQKILNVSQERLGVLERQVILKTLIESRALKHYFPELRRLLKRSTQAHFYRNMDRSIQNGRLCVTNQDEEKAIDELLTQRFEKREIRGEVARLALAYDAWLIEYEKSDYPKLLSDSIQKLRSGPIPGLPHQVHVFQAKAIEPLERVFWDEVSKYTRVSFESILEEKFSAKIQIERAHTLDDQAEFLADRLSRLPPAQWSRQVILIPDQPSIRRSLTRALERYGVRVLDPRDPTVVRSDSTYRSAFLPLDLVSSRFSSDKAVEWVKQFSKLENGAELVNEIAARGITSGLHRYGSGKLALLHEQFDALNEKLGKRLTIDEVSQFHMTWLNEWLLDSKTFFQSLWDGVRKECLSIGVSEKRYPLLYWLQRLKTHFDQAKPPVNPFRPSHGVQIFRLQQAPSLSSCDHLWFLGLQRAWLEPDSFGDYWFSSREREFLSSEFQIRSVHDIRSERRNIVKAWISIADQATVLESEYDWQGRALGNVESLLEKMDLEIKEGSSERVWKNWRTSYLTKGNASQAMLQLMPLGVKRVRATELDRYSRCGFQALGAYRWCLRDLREAGSDLWPEVKGNILHKAVELILREDLLVETALDRAWSIHFRRGFLQSRRVEQDIRRRLVRVLERFIEEEKKYQERSGTRVLELEDGDDLQLQFPHALVYGRPDRVDEHEDGLFVIDFKSSSQLPNGKEMVEQGYRLQLPFYALAVGQKYGRPVLGAQFVQLNSKGSRSVGVFSEHYNGKALGNLTHTRSKLNIFNDLGAAWAQARGQIESALGDYSSAKYSASPRNLLECRLCSYRDLCGERRRSV